LPAYLFIGVVFNGSPQVTENGLYLPHGRSLGRDLGQQLLCFGDVTTVESQSEQRRAYPFVGRPPRQRSLARGHRDDLCFSGELLVTLPAPLPVQARQVTRRVVVVQICRHSALVAADRLVDVAMALGFVSGVVG
jgi:hypothetical protein